MFYTSSLSGRASGNDELRVIVAKATLILVLIGLFSPASAAEWDRAQGCRLQGRQDAKHHVEGE
jgi:hypothetical protein